MNNLRGIFKKMLLFGKLNSNSIKELKNLIIQDNQVVDFNNSSNTLNDQVDFFFNLNCLSVIAVADNQIPLQILTIILCIQEHRCTKYSIKQSN